MWTVDREFEQRIRHAKQTSGGGDFLANLTLRLTPDLGVDGVAFASEAKNENVAYYVADVERGVRRFIEEQANIGRHIRYLRVTLVDMPIHPTDAKPNRFAEAAGMALNLAFELHGVELPTDEIGLASGVIAKFP